jgi:menaquinone-dependent protoporphyrinogen IX oxidase
MTSDPRGDRPPRVLLLYYTFTGQALRVLEAAGEVFSERGFQVHKARIEFTDRRFAERFSRFPLRHAMLDLLSMLPAQARRAAGEIRTPDEVRNGQYDLVCIGSSTWWFTMNMPMRTFLTSDEAEKLLTGTPFAAFCVCRRYWRGNFRLARKLGEKRGGRYMGGIHFEYLGGQFASGLSMISYLRSGQYRDRYLGVPIPASNVQPYQLEQTRHFAAELADRLVTQPAPR